VKLLLGAQANVQDKDIHEDTPLHLAAQYGHLGVVKLLLAANARPKERNIRGITSLQLATEFGHKEVYDTMKNYKKNENAREKKLFNLFK